MSYLKDITNRSKAQNILKTTDRITDTEYNSMLNQIKKTKQLKTNTNESNNQDIYKDRYQTWLMIMKERKSELESTRKKIPNQRYVITNSLINKEEELNKQIDKNNQIYYSNSSAFNDRQSKDYYIKQQRLIQSANTLYNKQLIKVENNFKRDDVIIKQWEMLNRIHLRLKEKEEENLNKKEEKIKAKFIKIV